MTPFFITASALGILYSLFVLLDGGLELSWGINFASIFIPTLLQTWGLQYAIEFEVDLLFESLSPSGLYLVLIFLALNIGFGWFKLRKR